MRHGGKTKYVWLKVRWLDDLRVYLLKRRGYKVTGTHSLGYITMVRT